MFEALQHHVDHRRKQSAALATRLLGKKRVQTLALRKFALSKVPLLLACSPNVVELGAEACAVEIPLSWRTKNHYRSMYFGALACGADISVGLLADHLIQLTGGKISLLFKDFRADFLRRAEADVLFTCREGPAIAQAVKHARETGERVNLNVAASASVPKKDNEQVATFALTLSLKATRRA